MLHSVNPPDRSDSLACSLRAWWCAFCGLGLTCDDRFPPRQHATAHFQRPESLPPQPLATTGFYTVSPALPFPERHARGLRVRPFHTGFFHLVRSIQGLPCLVMAVVLCSSPSNRVTPSLISSLMTLACSTGRTDCANSLLG